MVKIAPSILSANFAKMGEEVVNIVKDGADYIHIDVMDGVFVPNLTFGFKMIKDIRKLTDSFFDVHLMIVEPERYIKGFVDAGADLITVHYEATKQPIISVLKEIRAQGVKSAVSIKPDTPVSVLKELLPYVDLILIMSVYPGFGGQSFIENSIDRIKQTKKLVDEYGGNIDIEVDGGITLENVRSVKDAGANIIVAGSTIFKQENRAKIIKELKDR